MITIYGSMLCPDCVQCRNELDQAGVQYEYHDFGEDLRSLKTFLKLRDREAIFAQAKENGSIGIPCIVREDGSVTLDWSELLM